MDTILRMGSVLNKLSNHIGNENKAARTAWLEKTLRKLPEGIKILDAGAGEQQYKEFCSHLDYTSQDFCEYTGEGDRAALQTGTFDTSQIDIVSDITSIPLPDESFDAILCTEVIEHVPDPIKAIDELKRLLKKGGTLILTAPFISLTHYAPYHFFTGFNRYFYTQHFKESFEIIELTPNGTYYDLIAQEVRRISWIAEKYSQSRIRFISKLAIGFLLIKLNRLKRKDRGSRELGCYGYQLVAKKR